jgi:hypothetical protein
MLFVTASQTASEQMIQIGYGGGRDFLTPTQIDFFHLGAKAAQYRDGLLQILLHLRRDVKSPKANRTGKAL